MGHADTQATGQSAQLQNRRVKRPHRREGSRETRHCRSQRFFAAGDYCVEKAILLSL